MIKTSVFLNGQAMTEGNDYEWIQNELAFGFAVTGHTEKPTNSDRRDIVRVETYDEGILVQRDTYLAAKTAPKERFRWHQRTTEKFRERDL